MLIVFKTDSSVGAEGWRATYRETLGAMFVFTFYLDTNLNQVFLNLFLQNCYTE